MLKNKNYIRSQKKSSRSPAKILLIIGLLLVVAVVGAYFAMKQPAKKTTSSSYQKTSTGHDVNLDPPTEEDKQQNDQNKQQLGDKQQTTTPPPSETQNGKKTVTPFIVFAGEDGTNITVNGYVSGIFEEGGTCTATFTKGTFKITKTSKGIQDSNHTTCAPISAAASEFTGGGTWNVILSYASSTASGSSQTGSVVIQ